MDTFTIVCISLFLGIAVLFLMYAAGFLLIPTPFFFFVCVFGTPSSSSTHDLGGDSQR